MAANRDSTGRRPPGHQALDAETWIRVSNSLGLSTRGLEITKGIFDDEPECAMAARLGISAHTVHSHIERLYRRLQVNSRVQLVVRVLAELQHPRTDGQPNDDPPTGAR